ncbi:hypothetical protein [Synechococcus sp. PCC 6312]|uniref:hypothetical protein n=1 Tax=Synechococcus sp. (strain ATCC 27167 / PCC 6312) TaxID=195253 RepID=UPI00029EF517|nr:hypothetical protein [Synechococcus sp. PCC 6312]AFY60088.1 hypothetical protein Syn6312_0880 [Synechococcus sp. PCC 6312]
MRNLGIITTLTIIFNSFVMQSVFAEEAELIRLQHRNRVSRNCLIAIMRVEDDLINRFVLNRSSIQQEKHFEYFNSYTIFFVLSYRQAGRDILYSPKLITDLAKDVFINCKDSNVSSVVFGMDASSIHVQFGEVNGKFSAFKCIEDVVPKNSNDRYEYPRIMPWGYQACAL